jgi:hypothetical protein
MAFMYNNKETATDTDDCLSKWSDNLVTAGWTLHDDQSAAGTPYIIMSSDGENSDQETVYVQLTRGTADRLQFYIYMDWNATTHTGVSKLGSASYSYILTDDDASFDMWMSANGDGFILITLVGTAYNLCHVGLIEPFDDTEGTLDTAISSGSNVDISLGSGEAAGFEVGKRYQIVGGGYRDPLSVTAVNLSTDTVTVASVPRTYAIGSKFGAVPFKWYHLNSRNTSAMMFLYRMDGAGNGNEATYSTVNYQMVGFSAVDPDARSSGNDNFYPMYPRVFYDSSTTGIVGMQPEDSLWLIMDFITTSGHTVSVTELDSGTSSGSNTSTTLNDTTKSWTADEYNGKAIIITAGTGAGEIRTISDTTSTQITVGSAWTTTPDATSEYVICEEAWMFFYVNNSTGYQGAMRCA